MTLIAEFTPLELDRLRDMAHRMKDEGWRFIQTHAVNCGDTVDLYYSFMKDGKVVNYRVEGVTSDMPVPSITDIFLAAFVFENEARELFGVDMRDIVLDFQGGLYAPAEMEPMRFISPEQKAQIDKARKAAAAEAAKAQAADAGTGEAPAAGSKPWHLSDEKRAKLEEKLAGMDPAKAEKVRAALAAKEAASQAAAPLASAKTEEPEKADQSAKTEQAEEAAASDKPAVDSELNSKLAIMDPEKAEKVRAAIAARNGGVATADTVEGEATKASSVSIDSEVQAKLSIMEAEKAARVLDAIARHASSKGGE